MSLPLPPHPTLASACLALGDEPEAPPIPDPAARIRAEFNATLLEIHKRRDRAIQNAHNVAEEDIAEARGRMQMRLAALNDDPPEWAGPAVREGA